MQDFHIKIVLGDFNLYLNHWNTSPFFLARSFMAHFASLFYCAIAVGWISILNSSLDWNHLLHGLGRNQNSFRRKTILVHFLFTTFYEQMDRHLFTKISMISWIVITDEGILMNNLHHYLLKWIVLNIVFNLIEFELVIKIRDTTVLY